MVDASTAVNEAKQAISSVKKRVSAFQEEINSIQQLRRPISKQAPLVISFVGKFKTGKSSLLNALLGADLLPTRATTATAVVTRIFRGDTTQAWLYEGETQQSITLETAKDIILNYHATDPDHPAEVVIEAPIPWLGDDVELRDTPGMDDSAQDGFLEELALSSLQDTDLCVCVYDAGSMISAKERERAWKIDQQMNHNVIHAVNCTNRLNSIERVNEVEQLCQTFFGAMSPSSASAPGLGKYYLMCSAPKMVDLDGFDTWLRDIVSKRALAQRISIRETTVSGQLAAKYAELSERAKEQKGILQAQGKLLEARQAEIVQARRHTAENAAKQKAERIRTATSPAAACFLDTDGLGDTLSACKEKSNWQETYSNDTKSKSIAFFRQKYSTMCRQYSSFFKDQDAFISNTITPIEFPGPHIVRNEASAGERIGGAGIGAALGFAVGGPVGGLIGGFLGRAIGGADNGRIDLSVPNTVSFIESNVIPKLRTAFESMAYSLARKTERDGKNNVETRIISVENVLREIRQLSSALDAYIDHREGKPSTIEEPCQEQPSGAALLCQVLEQGKKAQLSALCQTLEKARQNQMGSQYRYFKEHLN